MIPVWAASICLALGACSQIEETGRPAAPGGKVMNFQLSSSVLEQGQPIPKKYTGDGSDVSPALQWTDPPPGTAGFVLIAEDPDAPMGTWVHWVLYDIPPDVRRLDENMPQTEIVLGAAHQGRNDFGEIGYNGPAPPPGRPHRYFFKLYAVDINTDLPAGARKHDVLDRIQRHILATAELMGTYKR
jgi:Raf kinase inhibitor-like YbhB/YbcL family protein